MANREIKYTVTAEAAPFAAGMQRVGDVLAGMRSKLADHGREFAGLTESMRAQFASVASGMRQEVVGMAGQFGGMAEALGRTRLGLVALTAAAGAYAASKAVDATAKMTEDTMTLARVMGTSTNEAQRWRIALDDVGATQGELEAASKGMSRQLREHEADMKSLGLQTRDSAGHLRPLNELMQEGIAIVADHAAGTDRAMAAQVLLGRGVDASSKLLLVENQTLDDATQTMAELGLEVGANAVAAWNEFDAASDRAHFSLQALTKAAGDVLMPVLADLVNMFNSIVPAAVTVVRGSLGGLATAWHLVKNGVVVVWETINAMVVTVAEPIRALAEALGRAVTGDFAGAAAAIQGIGGIISGSWGRAMDTMVQSSQRTRSRIDAIFSADTASGEPEGKGGSKHFVEPPDKAKKERKGSEAKEPSFMAYYEGALAEEKRLAANTDALHEYSKSQELAYWRNLLDNAELSSKDRVAIAKKTADLETQILRDTAGASYMAYYEQALEVDRQLATEKDATREYSKAQELQYWQELRANAELTAKDQIAIDRKVAELRMQVLRESARQRQALDAEQLRAHEQAALDELEIQRQAAQGREALGEITRAQLLEQERVFEERRNEIRLQALLARRATMDPERDPVAYAQICAQIEALEREHRQRMAGIDIGQKVEAQKENPLKNILDGAQQSLEQGIAGMLTRAQTLRQGLASIWAGIRQTIAGEIARIIAAKAAAFLRERLFATAEVATNAAKAGSGAAASQAGIPIVGPGLALAAMAAVMAAVMGMQSKVPSAAQGWDIPRGLNPMAQLHEQEMVLPAEHAQVIRTLAGQSQGGHQAPAINLQGVSAGEFFIANRRELTSALKALHRDFAL